MGGTDASPLRDGERTCSKCRGVKPVTEFYVVRRKALYGVIHLMSWCKKCCIEADGERRKKRIRERRKQQRKERHGN